MGSHVDLAIVKVGSEFPRIYEAPSFSGLKRGDAVVVETDQGNVTGTVEACVTIGKTYQREVIDFMLLSAGCTEPLNRVRYKIEYKKMIFEDEGVGRIDRDDDL